MSNAQKNLEVIKVTLDSVRQLWREAEHFGIKKTDVERIEDACNEFFNLLEPISYQIEMIENSKRAASLKTPVEL